MSGSSDIKFKILDKIGTATVVVDGSTGEILYANNEMENISYFTRSEIESKSIFDFFGQSDAQKIRDLFELRAFKEQDRALGECNLHLIRKSQAKTHVALFVYDTDDEDIKVVTVRDDTNIKAAEWRLAESQASLIESEKFRSLGVMAGGIAHEINNPLAIIQGVAEWIQEFPDVDEVEIASMMDQIIGATARIAGVVKGLRIFSKETSSDDMSMVSVQSIIKDTLMLCKERMVRSDINIEVIAPSEPLMIYCNSTMMSQVLLNLLNNSHDAIKGTEKPWVKIEARSEKNLVNFHVVDSGQGIAKEIRSKIMEPFFTTKKVGQGAGLGLSLARGITESQNAELMYDPLAKNTRFTIAFPVPDKETWQKAKEEKGREVLEVMSENKMDRSDACIMVVDDEPELRQLLTRRIRMHGYRTVEASCGEEAFEKLDQMDVDVILSDVRMTHGDGFWLLEKVNEMRSLVPVIFITGSVNISLENMFEMGAQAVFHKPVNMKALEARIDELLYSKRYIWRRRQLRIRHQQTVRIGGKVVGERHYEVQSMSRGGMFAASHGELPIVGEIVRFAMQLNFGSAKKVDINGEAIVRWVREEASKAEPRGVGIEIISFEGEGKAKYFEYVNALYTESDLLDAEEKKSA